MVVGYATKIRILPLVLILLLIGTFFFKIIPVPVENMEGANNSDKFIFGGFYWTSAFNQLSLANYKAFFLYSFLIFTIGGTYIYFKEYGYK